MQNNNRTPLINRFLNPGALILLLVIFWMLYRNLQLTKESGYLNNRNISLVQDSTNFVKQVNSLGDSITIQSQLILSEGQASDLLKEELETLKKVKSNTKVITKTVIKEVLVPHHPEAEVVEINQQDFLKIPSVFSDSTSHYTFSATVKKQGLQINKLQINNSTSVTLGLQKRGFFRKSEPVITVTHSNPYVMTTGMTNVTIDQKKPFYETRTFNIGVGFLLGVAVAK